MYALHFQAQSRVAALSSSTICSEPSLKPRDSRKPTRQKLPTMQGTNSKGSVWNVNDTLQKNEIIFGVTPLNSGCLLQSSQRSSYTRRRHTPKKSTKIKVIEKRKKKLIKILSLNKYKHTLVTLTGKEDFLKFWEYLKIFLQKSTSFFYYLE